MTYTNNYVAPSWRSIANSKGSLVEKLSKNAELLEDEFDAIESAFGEMPGIISYSVTVGGGGTSLASSGFDLADGAGGTTYGVFVAPYDITITSIKLLTTEAYVKDTDDAVISVVDNAAEPANIGALTLDSEGVDAGQFVQLTLDEVDVAAGTALNVKVVATGDTTGTGHGIIVIEYKLG